MTKLCRKCNQTKDLDSFYIRKLKTGSGAQSACKDCTKSYATNRYASHPDKVKAYNHFSRIKWLYGVEKDDYFSQLASQKGRCMFCPTVPSETRRLDVDHCHISGVVRGLLCNRCNKALGLAGDDSSRLRDMADYLDSKGRWIKR